ncbi:MAG: lipid-A-disaccharide synthase N-terminal domain-containing protein [Parachlamydiaceae bacterium]|nr:lipid-A-disaccharide synthase N-terminal domain-containing protein [Parachlamydiaceae bacterium]
MSEELRQFLYPLGIIPALIFGLRYLVQWFSSERAGKSLVMPLFWRLSILGNLLFMIHALIQMQFHVCVVQACSGVISWRNLNLMQPSSKHIKFSTTVKLLIMAASTVVLLFLGSSFLSTSFFSFSSVQWFRSPLSSDQNIHGFWHFVGFLGLVLFNGRFWLQWRNAEKHHRSYLSAGFWWMSVFGSVLCFAYFAVLGDFVNMIGPFFGLVPSIRNLILMRRTEDLKD